MSKHVGERCEKRADGDPDGRRVGRTETWTDITIPSYVLSEDGRIKNQGGDCKTLQEAPDGNKVEKAILASRSKSNHKAIDFGVIWKGIISGVCMPNMKSLSLTVQMLWRRLKFTTDRQTYRQADSNSDRQTNKQTGQKQYAPIIRSGDIKIKLIE